MILPGGGHSNPLQCSCLESPMNRGAWWATVHGITKSRTWLKWLGTHAIAKAHETHTRREAMVAILECAHGWEGSLHKRAAGLRPLETAYSRRESHRHRQGRADLPGAALRLTPQRENKVKAMLSGSGTARCAWHQKGYDREASCLTGSAESTGSLAGRAGPEWHSQPR